MAFIKCRSCGYQISSFAKFCPRCGAPNNAEAVTPAPPAQAANQSILPQPVQQPQPVAKPQQEVQPVVTKPQVEPEVITIIEDKPKKSRMWLWLLLVALLLILIGGGIGGYFYYQNVYLPEKIDREAPRTYPIVNLVLRQTKMADGDFNKITTIPMGGELITYEQDNEWARVKYVPNNPNEKPMEGYVASPYLIDKSDLYLLNSIFGDDDARDVLATTKVRKALLEVYKGLEITGKLSSEVAEEAGLEYTPSAQWQVYLRNGQRKPNEVLFKRAMNPYSEFTDLLVLIENVQTGERQLIYATFDDDETHHIRGVYDAPRSGMIKDYWIDSDGDLAVKFDNGYEYINYYQL
ncbi:MAG: zinc-ribbon domain-containing protein [Muribaculaceae bacterium]|nr:zinc-ribbon domain-containing protein [Muribaculaceae bacterium]